VATTSTALAQRTGASTGGRGMAAAPSVAASDVVVIPVSPA
jgi:hypothetical protein